jgi:hypothetical protein
VLAENSAEHEAYHFRLRRMSKSSDAPEFVQNPAQRKQPPLEMAAAPRVSAYESTTIAVAKAESNQRHAEFQSAGGGDCARRKPA